MLIHLIPELREILNQVISTEVSNNLYTTEEVADFVEIVKLVIPFHKTLKDSNISPAEVAQKSLQATACR